MIDLLNKPEIQLSFIDKLKIVLMFAGIIILIAFIIYAILGIKDRIEDRIEDRRKNAKIKR